MKYVSKVRFILLASILSTAVQGHYYSVKTTITTLRPKFPNPSVNNGSFTPNVNDSRSSVEHETDLSRTIPNETLTVAKKRSILDHDSLVLALRLTCEVNRRLHLGTMSFDSVRNDQASIFYTPPAKRMDLSLFIEKIHKAFCSENDPFVAAVIMIYLDRACSVETYRVDDRSIACPYVTKANVHKLYLAASVLALRAVRNELPPILSRGAFHDDITDVYFKKLQGASDEIIEIITSSYELGTLIEWMFASLGTDGTMVNIEQVRSFIDKWKSLFQWEDKVC